MTVIKNLGMSLMITNRAEAQGVRVGISWPSNIDNCEFHASHKKESEMNTRITKTLYKKSVKNWLLLYDMHALYGFQHAI